MTPLLSFREGRHYISSAFSYTSPPLPLPASIFQLLPLFFSCLAQPYYGDAPPIILWRGARTFLLPFHRLYLPFLFQHVYSCLSIDFDPLLNSHTMGTPLPSSYRGATHYFFCLSLDLACLASSSMYFSTIPPVLFQRGAPLYYSCLSLDFSCQRDNETMGTLKVEIIRAITINH